MCQSMTGRTPAEEQAARERQRQEAWKKLQDIAQAAKENHERGIRDATLAKMWNDAMKAFNESNR